MNIQGKIKQIYDAQQVSATFRKREFVLTTEEQYPQHILLDLSQDKCDILNNYEIGDLVNVSINLRGREWVNPQGETKYFNSIQAWRIDRVQNNDSAQPQQQNHQHAGQEFTDPNFNPNGNDDDNGDLPF